MNYKKYVIKELFSVEGQVAAITGASGHLMSHFAFALALNGVKVALLDIDLEKGNILKKQIEKAGGIAIFLKTDVSKISDILDAQEKISKEFGHTDILINGANANAPTPFLDIDEQEWNKIFDIQLNGTMRCCKIFGKPMIKKKSGLIVNLSSASANPPLSKAFTYSSAKAAVLNLTKNLAREWAIQGVRVNAIRPGFFPTKWSQKNFLNKRRINDIMKHTPMKRFGKPEELVGALLWLCSPSASFVTGSEITIDGGFSSMTI